MAKIKFIVLVFLAMAIMSCDTYSTKDLIDAGSRIKRVNSEKLKQLSQKASELAESPCVLYQISTSRERTYFAFESFKYDTTRNATLLDEVYDYDDELVSFMRENIPYKEMTDYGFLKDVYVEFYLEFYRDKELDNTSLLYVIDKETFLKLYPNFKEYNEENIHNLTNKSENWIYFYDDEWAITTSSTVYKMPQKECLKIVGE